jgi:hypothetical protein
MLELHARNDAVNLGYDGPRSSFDVVDALTNLKVSVIELSNGEVFDRSSLFLTNAIIESLLKSHSLISQFKGNILKLDLRFFNYGHGVTDKTRVVNDLNKAVHDSLVELNYKSFNLRVYYDVSISGGFAVLQFIAISLDNQPLPFYDRHNNETFEHFVFKHLPQRIQDESFKLV